MVMTCFGQRWRIWQRTRGVVYTTHVVLHKDYMWKAKGALWYAVAMGTAVANPPKENFSGGPK